MDYTIKIDPVSLIIGLTDEQREELRKQIGLINMTTIHIANSFYTIRY